MVKILETAIFQKNVQCYSPAVGHRMGCDENAFQKILQCHLLSVGHRTRSGKTTFQTSVQCCSLPDGHRTRLVMILSFRTTSMNLQCHSLSIDHRTRCNETIFHVINCHSLPDGHRTKWDKTQTTSWKCVYGHNNSLSVSDWKQYDETIFRRMYDVLTHILLFIRWDVLRLPFINYLFKLSLTNCWSCMGDETSPSQKLWNDTYILLEIQWGYISEECVMFLTA